MIEKVKQFTKAFEEMDELKMDESEKEEDFFLGENVHEYPVRPFPLSQRGEILNQWKHFTAFLSAFERVLKNRVSQKDLWKCIWSDIWGSYTKLMDEGTYFETELSLPLNCRILLCLCKQITSKEDSKKPKRETTSVFV